MTANSLTIQQRRAAVAGHRHPRGNRQFRRGGNQPAFAAARRPFSRLSLSSRRSLVSSCLVRTRRIAERRNLSSSEGLGNRLRGGVGFHTFDVKGIASGTGPVKFRVRVLTDDPLFPTRPWMYVEGNGALETDLRILE